MDIQRNDSLVLPPLTLCFRGGIRYNSPNLGQVVFLGSHKRTDSRLS